MNTEPLNQNCNYSTWGFFGTMMWGIIIALVFIITQVIAIIIYIEVQHENVESTEYTSLITDLEYNGTVISICTFATLLLCSSMILGIVKLKRHSNIYHYLGLNKVDLKTIKYCILVAIAFIVTSDLLALFLDKPLVPEFMTSAYTSTDSLWMLWLALIVAAPLFEELFFRGFLISGFCASFAGPVGAILISSASWAAIHLQYDLYDIATIFILGLALGFVRFKTGSIFPTLGMHSFINLTATIEAAIYVS